MLQPCLRSISLYVCCVYAYVCTCVCAVVWCRYLCPCESQRSILGTFLSHFFVFFLFVCLLYRGGRNDFWEVKKHIPVSGKGHREMSPLMYFFSGGVSHWSTDNVWAHWFSLTAQPVSSWDLPCLPPCVFIILLRLRNAAGQGLSHGCWGPNSALHAHTASTLPRDPSSNLSNILKRVYVLICKSLLLC